MLLRYAKSVGSLSQLKDIPFDTVKIDKIFLSHEADREVVLRSIVKLSHDLGRSVVLEGVETEADALRLKDLGCEYAQGFFYSEPLARNDVPVFIAGHRARTT